MAQRAWAYEQEGLTGLGAALVALAVAWATGGMGAELLGTSGAVSTAAANAGFSSLASMASVSLINNGGDIAHRRWKRLQRQYSSHDWHQRGTKQPATSF